MKTPQFWHKKNLLVYLLLPFSALYLLGHFLNCWRKVNFFSGPTKINKPIICIGNLVAGGAGKTPVALAIGKILQELQIDFAYLSAGYGGKIKDVTMVDKVAHSAISYSALEVGDEPLLLAEIAQTFVAKNRIAGAKKIAALPEKKLIVMDDGLQNPSIIKDFSILVIDGGYGFGNGLIMPAGALREPIRSGIKKADLIIIIGDDKSAIAENYCQNKQVLRAKTKVTNQNKFAKKSFIAFCGIGRPEKFFASLAQSQITVIAKFSYADHHQYTSDEIEKMINLANKNNVGLITTKKDWVRLAPSYKNQIEYLDIEIEFENISCLKEKLNMLINAS